MGDIQATLSILGCVVIFLYVVMNLSYVSEHGLYKKKYDELKRGVYKYEPNAGESHYFYLYSYDIDTLTFTRTDVAIIFFLDGDIKLTDNSYIHKSHLFMSLYTWYYWRKFQRIKNHFVLDHHFRETYRRMSDTSRDLNVYIKKQNKLDFKFLRG